jgi:hypothetical protein
MLRPVMWMASILQTSAGWGDVLQQNESPGNPHWPGLSSCPVLLRVLHSPGCLDRRKIPGE